MNSKCSTPSENMLLLTVFHLSLLFAASYSESDSDSDCTETPKIGSCPPSLINPDELPCDSNDDCSGIRVCCYGGGNISRCSDPLETKGYDCPEPENTQEGEQSCLLDSECPGEEKCCPGTSCSYSCTPPKKELQIDFRASNCKITIPSDARCPNPPLLTKTGMSCTANLECATNPNGNERMCCPDGTGNFLCAEPYTTRKGECPSQTSQTFPVETSAGPCMVDTNCPTPQRCCVGPANCQMCVQPINTGVTPCFSVSKVGACPALPINEGRASCMDHSECPGNRLCCRRSFSTERRCSDPFPTINANCPSPSNILMSAPSCLVDQDCPSGYKCCGVSNCSYFCTQMNGGTPDPFYCGTADKYGTCPGTLKNPTVVCRTHYECPGRQLCCRNRCSDPASSKRGQCPPNGQVSRAIAECKSDTDCGVLSNQKCCADSNCNYYCTYSAI